MGVRLGREQEIGAARQHSFAARLAGEEIVAEIDGTQLPHTLAMRGEPALGGVALAVLLLGAVRLGDELGHQQHDHIVLGRDDRRRQHRVIKLGPAVRTLARLAIAVRNGSRPAILLRTAELLRAEIFGSVERDQGSSAKALEFFHAARRAQRRNHLIKRA